MSELPRGWVESTLGEIADTKLGKMLSAKARNTDGRPYLRNKNVQWGRIDTDDLLRMDFSDDEFEKFRLREGDLLVCEGGEVGRAAIWRAPLADCAYQKALHRVRPLGGVMPEYLLYLLMHYAGSHQFDRFVTGSTIAHLPQEDLRRLPVAVPPLAEQRRIVAAIEEQLSRLDAASESLVFAKKRSVGFSRSILTRAASEGPERHLGELLDGIEAGRSFGGPGRAASAEEWGVIRVSAMTWGEFRPNENKMVPDARVDPRWEIRRGDLLVSRANTTELVGATVLVGDVRRQLLLSDKSLRLRVKPHIDKAWLRYALSAPQSRRQISVVASGTSDSMRNVSQEKLRAVRVRVPSAERQTEIAAAVACDLERVGALRSALSAAEAAGDNLRRAVLASAFRGELVPQDPSDEPASVLLERIAAERAAAPPKQRRRRVPTGH